LQQSQNIRLATNFYVEVDHQHVAKDVTVLPSEAVVSVCSNIPPSNSTLPPNNAYVLFVVLEAVSSIDAARPCFS